jgi:hypothetical protein
MEPVSKAVEDALDPPVKKRTTTCSDEESFSAWELLPANQLVTLERTNRCGVQRNEALRTEFAAADTEQTSFGVKVLKAKPKRFARPHPGAGQ